MLHLNLKLYFRISRQFFVKCVLKEHIAIFISKIRGCGLVLCSSRRDLGLFYTPITRKLKKYEGWFTSDNQTEIFFGDLVSDCFKLKVSAETFWLSLVGGYMQCTLEQTQYCFQEILQQH